MRIAHSFTVRGVSMTETLLFHHMGGSRDPNPGQRPLLERDPIAERPPGQRLP